MLLPINYDVIQRVRLFATAMAFPTAGVTRRMVLASWCTPLVGPQISFLYSKPGLMVQLMVNHNVWFWHAFNPKPSYLQYSFLPIVIVGLSWIFLL
jgi:hypothetical protein